MIYLTKNQKLNQKIEKLENLIINLTNELDVSKKELNMIKPFIDRLILKLNILDLILKNQNEVFDKIV